MTTKAPTRQRKGPPKGKLSTKIKTKPDFTKIVALNFRVSGSFKKDFKIAAANLGITQSDLLLQVFEEWQQRQE